MPPGDQRPFLPLSAVCPAARSAAFSDAFPAAFPGAFVSVSGAGMLASSEKKADAQKFLEFLTDELGQQGLADSYALEYPLNPAVSLEPPVKPFADLQPPPVDVTSLDSEKVVDLMTEVGFL